MLSDTHSKDKTHPACERDEMKSRMRQSRTSGSVGGDERQRRRLPDKSNQIVYSNF
jgi:hypothetical protein